MPTAPPKQAYAILAGGGVKGAALAGCLAHATKLGIQFVGYGGSSAGSLVATLSAIGCSTDELHQLLVNTPFVDIVAPDDRGARVKALARLLPGKWSKRAIAGMLTRGFTQLPLLSDVTHNCGLLDGAGLTGFLGREFAKRGIPTNIRFSQLAAHVGSTLKVMCTDLTLRKAVEFGTNGESTRDPEVITAVRASCGYPFIFRPQADVVVYEIAGSKDGRKITHQLVDGGLASNLPISLFFDESLKSNVPIIAFDLVQEVAPHEGEYTMTRMMSDVFATALSSGDTMAQRLMNNVIHVPVIIPPDINTFDIHLDAKDAERLFEKGLEYTEQKLGAAPPTVAGTLEAMVKQFAARWPEAIGLRASVLMPDGAGNLVIRHAHNMKGATDLVIKVPISAGVAGVTWVVKDVRAADPQEARLDGLPPEQKALIPRDRRAVICFPIRPPNVAGTAWDPVGVLALDSSTPLQQTGWLDDAKMTSDLGAKWATQLAPLVA
jgi:NTE family protein